MFDDVLIDTERLQFRKLIDSDAERLFHIYSDKIAMRHRGSKPMMVLDDAKAMIRNQSKSDKSEKSSRYAIIEESEQLLIGTLLFKYDSNVQDQCEIGYSFDKNYWNKGYGQETTVMLMSRFEKIKHFKDLKAWCKKENIASIKILEKLGFSVRNQSDYPGSYLYILSLNN